MSGSIRKAATWAARSAGRTAKCAPKWSSPGCCASSAWRTRSSALNRHYRPAVITQLLDRLEDVGDRLVLAFLEETLRRLRLPVPHQLLERRDVEVAVVEVRLELRHPARKEAPVLADRVAAHRRGAGRNVLAEEL